MSNAGFKEVPQPEAISMNSPEGQKAMAALNIFGGLAHLIGMQAFVNAVSYFMAAAAAEANMSETDHEEALDQMRQLIRFNRANIQSKTAAKSS